MSPEEVNLGALMKTPGKSRPRASASMLDWNESAWVPKPFSRSWHRPVDRPRHLARPIGWHRHRSPVLAFRSRPLSNRRQRGGGRTPGHSLSASWLLILLQASQSHGVLRNPGLMISSTRVSRYLSRSLWKLFRGPQYASGARPGASLGRYEARIGGRTTRNEPYCSSDGLKDLL